MLQKHRAEILAYEIAHGESPDGTNSSNDRIAAANNDYGLTGNDRVQSLFDALTPARDAFITWLNSTNLLEGQPALNAYAGAF